MTINDKLLEGLMDAVINLLHKDLKIVGDTEDYYEVRFSKDKLKASIIEFFNQYAEELKKDCCKSCENLELTTDVGTDEEKTSKFIFCTEKNAPIPTNCCCKHPIQ